MRHSADSVDAQVYEYYAIDPEISFPKMWFQFQEDTVLPNGKAISNLFYGFPSVPWGTPNLCRIAVDTATNVIADPNERQYPVISPDDLENTRTWLAEHVRGVGPSPLPIFAGTCLQTNVADNMFVLDHVPDGYLHRAHERVDDNIPFPVPAEASEAPHRRARTSAGACLQGRGGDAGRRRGGSPGRVPPTT